MLIEPKMIVPRFCCSKKNIGFVLETGELVNYSQVYLQPCNWSSLAKTNIILINIRGIKQWDLYNTVVIPQFTTIINPQTNL